MRSFFSPPITTPQSVPKFFSASCTRCEWRGKSGDAWWWAGIGCGAAPLLGSFSRVQSSSGLRRVWSACRYPLVSVFQISSQKLKVSDSSPLTRADQAPKQTHPLTGSIIATILHVPWSLSRDLRVKARLLPFPEHRRAETKPSVARSSFSDSFARVRDAYASTGPCNRRFEATKATTREDSASPTR